MARVILRYGLPGAGRGTSPAKLIEAGDADALEAAGIKEPFGYFVGTVPAAARWVVADAQDATGRRLGSADFTALMKDGHPQTVFIAERR